MSERRFFTQRDAMCGLMGVNGWGICEEVKKIVVSIDAFRDYLAAQRNVSLLAVRLGFPCFLRA